jgi:retinol dehydrogenase-12
MNNLEAPPIPLDVSVTGRTFLVTGASSGIGQAMVEALAGRGADVVLASRSEDRTRAVLAGIMERRPAGHVDFLRVDVSDLSDVRRAAAEFLAQRRPLDVLVNNAGVAGTRSLSPQGFDRTYATNHIGPFLLTNLLLPALREAPQGRIVNVASIAHHRARAIPWSVLERRTKPRRSGFSDYAVTKLMNVLHAKELTRRLADTRITACSLHPGGVATNIWRAVPQPFRWLIQRATISREEGARTPLYCATAPELAHVSGRYYDRCREARTNPLADDAQLARELWTRTETAIASVAAPRAGAP